MEQKKCTKNSFEGVFEVKEKFNLFDWPFTLSWLSEDVTTQNKIIYIIIMCCRQVDEFFSVPEKLLMNHHLRQCAGTLETFFICSNDILSVYFSV